MRTAIGAAEHRSHLTFLSDGQTRTDAAWRHISKRLKTTPSRERARARVGFVRSFGIEIIKPFHHPSIFGSIGLFFREIEAAGGLLHS